jgi:hypothetical protein
VDNAPEDIAPGDNAPEDIAPGDIAPEGIALADMACASVQAPGFVRSIGRATRGATGLVT